MQKTQTYKIVANIELRNKTTHGIAYHPFVTPKNVHFHQHLTQKETSTTAVFIQTQLNVNYFDRIKIKCNLW